MLNVKVGEKVPEFCLPDKDGKEVCMKDFRGQWIVLYFYPKDNSKGCTREAIDFTSNHDDFKKMNAVILGISPDSVKSHQKFAEKHDLTVTLLSDEEKKVLEKIGVWQEKSMYGRTYFGVVRSTLLIDPKGEIKEIWEKVRVANHVDKVKARLSELHD
jgi:peroxiredoxin Q/BCP